MDTTLGGLDVVEKVIVAAVTSGSGPVINIFIVGGGDVDDLGEVEENTEGIANDSYDPFKLDYEKVFFGGGGGAASQAILMDNPLQS